MLLCIFLVSGCLPFVDNTSPKIVYWHLFLFNLFIFLNGISALPVSRFCHCSYLQYHTLQLEYHLLYQMFDRPLNIFPIFPWNMSPSGAAPNGGLVIMYLPTWHTNVDKHEDCFSSARLENLELISVMVM